VDWIVDNYNADIKAVYAGAVPFLMLMGIVSGGWQMARAALVAQQQIADGVEDPAFYEAKIMTARFYADHVMPKATALRDAGVGGGAVLELSLPQVSLLHRTILKNELFNQREGAMSGVAKRGHAVGPENVGCFCF
jgi:hypothetical protein